MYESALCFIENFSDDESKSGAPSSSAPDLASLPEDFTDQKALFDQDFNPQDDPLPATPPDTLGPL